MSEPTWIWGGVERDKFDSTRRYLSEADHVAAVAAAEERGVEMGWNRGVESGWAVGQRDALAAAEIAIAERCGRIHKAGGLCWECGSIIRAIKGEED
jgi:hypothetical protein